MSFRMKLETIGDKLVGFNLNSLINMQLSIEC